MKIVSLIFQLVIALGLINVWIVRFNKKTPYRGGNAQTMREEFASYGLPQWVMWAVGGVKLSCAACLLAGIWFPILVQPASAVIAVLMAGAIVMHFKVRDPLLKSLPAGIMLALSAFVLLNSL
ncbi:MAG: DoxX family protein [Verrucomicrobia bacterium]|nr:DoxX family protein [Verrucomicrobiota bacterium]